MFWSYLRYRKFQNSVTIKYHHRIILPISTFSGFCYINLLKSFPKKSGECQESSPDILSCLKYAGEVPLELESLYVYASLVPVKLCGSSMKML